MDIIIILGTVIKNFRLNRSFFDLLELTIKIEKNTINIILNFKVYFHDNIFSYKYYYNKIELNQYSFYLLILLSLSKHLLKRDRFFDQQVFNLFYLIIRTKFISISFIRLPIYLFLL